MIRNINNSNKLIISHIADIDGMGSIILANKYFDKKIDYILCEVLDLIEVFKEDLSEYETIYVCDLQICDDAIESINKNLDLANKIKHFDHHSSISNNRPSFVNSVVELDGRKTSGTELFFRYLLSLDNKLDNNFYKTLVEGIRAYDTWDKFGNFELGKKLTSIFAMIGAESFIELICNMNDLEDFKIPKVFLDLIKSDEAKMQKYIENANKNICKTNYKNYKIAVTISEQYRSILGDEICKMNPDIDFILIINFGRMSCSLRCTRDDLDLGKISQEFHHNGGGHKKAAGFIIDKESLPIIKPYIEQFLEQIKTEN